MKKALALVVMGVLWGGVAMGEVTPVDREIVGLGERPGGEKLEEVYGRAIDALILKLGGEDMEQRREAQGTLEEMVNHAARPGAEEQRLAVCKVIAKRIEGEVPPVSKYWLIRSIENVGKEEVVDALASRLKGDNPGIKERALCALMNNPASQAGQKIAAALPGASKKDRIALINALGYRHEVAEGVVEAMKESDGEVAKAAAYAIAVSDGKDQKAVNALADVGQLLFPSGPAWRADATFTFLDRHHLPMVRVPPIPGLPTKVDFTDPYRQSVRIGLLRSMVVSKYASFATPLLKEALNSTDASMQVQAAQIAGLLPLAEAESLGPEAGSKLSSRAKAVYLRTLGKQKTAESNWMVLLVLGSSDEVVKTAAIDVLGDIGEAGVVPVLLEAAQGSGGVQGAARESLDRLQGAGVDAALIAAAGQSTGKRRVEIARTLGVRREPSALSVLLEWAAKDMDAAVRVEALNALGIAGMSGQLDALLKLLADAKSEDEQKAAEGAIGQIVYRIRDVDRRAEPLIGAMEAAPNIRLALIRLLGRTGSPKALEILRKSLRSEDGETALAAVRAMSEWPDGAVAGDLMGFAKKSSAENARVLALRGYLRAVGLPSERSVEESVRLYAEALPLARTEEKKAILSGLANHWTVESLKIVDSLMEDSALVNESTNAAVRIARGLGKADPGLVREVMGKVQRLAKDERTKKGAGEVVAGLDKK